ncbi:hypothetical protein GCK72_021338 [Caenorhabditis remanei]|uniref:Uncharacterized protein n=1 Tax=Caenorhabditis remanei TaxID=31234 RepID=A0A6A5GJ05_CAERE|nr:hypothetical protein GCK72_021338 [Caenorhabditis remanei]KAF1754774.1 hypothetical protein GCK72_021338 [Caenorhabditis remanei]
MPIYNMTTGKRVDIEAGPGQYTVMEYNKKTGEFDCIVKEIPKNNPENSFEKILKWAEEKEKKKLAKKKQRKQAVPSAELSNSGNSSKSDSEDSDDIEKYSEEAKNRVYDWTPEENMRMIDNLRMKMLKMENEQSASEPDSESDSEDSEDAEEDFEGTGDSESSDSEYTHDSQSGVLTKHGVSEILKTGKIENSSEGFNLEDVKKVFDAKAKEMKEKVSALY